MFLQIAPAYVFAEEATPAPSPTTESASTPSEPAPVSQPSPTSFLQQTTAPSITPTPSAAPLNVVQTPSSPQPAITQQTGPLSDAEREQRKTEAKAAWEQTYLAAHPELVQLSNGKTGATTLTTGNATNSTVGVTSGNANVSSPLRPSGFEGQASGVSNVGNGAFSNNASSLTNGATVATDQTNSAKVGNNVSQTALTGKSSTSFNVGDSTLTTGNANVSGTAITGVNTNLSNVRVSEFNVVDNQKGDLVLSPEAFASSCIAGCSGSGLSAVNIGNGASSTNTTNAVNNSNVNTNQTNSAGVGNNLSLAANSGDNTGSFNTGGNTVINTGDANVSANSLTFANNNLAGGVTYGVVNIYGNLEGDIVLPEFASVGGSQNSSQTTGNGALSTNTASSNSTTNNNTFQNNDLTIANNVIVDGTTGNNGSNDNTSGNTTINTGKTTTDTNVLNIANSNISDGTWWLVLVNQAGNWMGKLLGGPDGANVAGSPGTDIKTDANGQITATNGAGSSNTTNVSSTTNTNTTQNNNADIQNNLNLSANTGGNKTDFNTGGHNTITTGDSNIIANLVNFVNNNISGNGRLVVTVVNVFGSWAGDFVTPGQQKQNTPLHPLGSAGQEPVSSSSNSGNAVQNAGENNNSNNPVSTTESIGSGFQSASDSASQMTPNDNVKVAGMSTSESNAKNMVAGAKERIIKINLAWVLLIVPLVIFAILRKKQFFIKLWRK